MISRQRRRKSRGAKSQTGEFTPESLGRRTKFQRPVGGAVPEENVRLSLSVEKKKKYDKIDDYTRLPLSIPQHNDFIPNGGSALSYFFPITVSAINSH